MSKIIITGDYFYGEGRAPVIGPRLKSVLEKCGHSVVGMEGVVADATGLAQAKKAIILSNPSLSVDQLPNAVANLSNNHSLDLGVEGLHKTKSNLTAQGVQSFGIDHLEGYEFDFNLNVGEKTVSFFTFGWKNEQCPQATNSKLGCRPFSYEQVNRLELQKKDNRVNVALIHAGYEFESYPLPHHVGLARHIVDQGFDLVIFSHTHCLQPNEEYRSAKIFYGLGNFYFSSSAINHPELSNTGQVVILDPLTLQIEHLFTEKSGNSLEVVDRPETKFEHSDLHEYNKVYKSLRTRKKNPRPILYFNRPVQNFISYHFWNSMVQVTGLLKIRRIVKRMIGWA